MTTEHGFWISAKNFFFRWPVTKNTDKVDNRKVSTSPSAKNLQQQYNNSDSSFYLNSFGSLNLP